MKRQFNLQHYTSADIAPSLSTGHRSFYEETYSREESPKDFESTDDVHEMLMRQGIVFFKDRALERMQQQCEIH